MNITKIKVSLTGEDLLSIYSEFVSVEGLEVKDIKINDEISITGRLNKGFNIDFLVLSANILAPIIDKDIEKINNKLYVNLV